MVALIFACLAVIAIILFLRFVLWYHMTLLFLILFSPDYLVIVGGAGAYTINNTESLTSSLGGRIAWGIMAMMLVWAIYFTFNSALYKASEVAYRVISFLLIVGCSLYIMFKLVLRLMEKVGPQLANDSATNHIIYICIAVVIALVAWLRRQAIMDELDEEGKLKLGSRRRSKAE